MERKRPPMHNHYTDMIAEDKEIAANPLGENPCNVSKFRPSQRQSPHAVDDLTPS